MILNYLDGTVQTTNTYTILNNLDTNIIPSVTSNINIGNTDKTIKELFVNDILLDEGDIIKRSRYSVDISTSNITSNIINTEENYIVFNLNQDDLDTNGNGTTTYTLDFTNITIGKVLINDFLGREYNIVLTSPITIDVGTTYSKIITNNNTYNTVGGLSNIESDITGSNIIYTSPIVIIRYYNWGYNTESYFNRNYYSLWNRPYIPTKEIDFYNQEYINDYSIKRVFKNIYYENFYDAKMPTDTIDTLTENLNNELILNNLDANDYFQVISLRYTRDNINSSITDSTTIETGPHFISEDDTQYSTNKYIAFRGKDGAKYRFFITQDISNLIKMTDSITISYIVGSGSVNNGIEDYGNGGDKPINGALRIQILNSNNNIIFNEIIWNSSSGYNANWQLYTISIDNTTRQNGIKLKIVHIYNPSTNTNENWNQTFGIRYIGLNLLNEYKNYINLENIPTSYPTSNNILWSDNYGNLKIDNYQYSQNYNTLENIPFDITTNYIYTNLNKNIGIGTTIPQETLQVNGNTIINSNLTVGSNIYFSGDLYKNGNLYTSYTDNDTSNYLLNNLDTDIVPKDDLTYNLGSPDKKFNELFIGNNSIWFGDTHKISISNNKLKFKKIKTDIIPSGLVTKLDGIINHSEIEQDIKTFTNLTNLSDINLGQWLKYARSKNPSVENINEIFTDVDIDDETQDETIWITNSTSIYNNTSYDKIGIGTTNPTHNLHIEGDTLINGNLLINDLNIMTHIENTSNNLVTLLSNNSTSFGTTTTHITPTISPSVLYTNEKMYPPTPPTGLPSGDDDVSQTNFNFDLMEANTAGVITVGDYQTQNTIVGFTQVIDNGVYEFRTNNSGASNGKFYRLFTDDTNNYYIDFYEYIDTDGRYNITGYNNHDLTIFSDGTSQRGCWVEVGMPNKIVLTKYSFRMKDNESYRNNRSLEEWIICGSNDRNTWTKIHDVPNDIELPDVVINTPGNLVDIVYKTFDTPEPFKYIRKILIKIDTDNWFAHTSLKLYGKEVLVNIEPQPITYYIPERMYPPTRDLTSASHTISGEAYGNGLYETWESTYYNTAWKGFSAFQESVNVGYHALGYQYSTSTGSYTESNYIVSGYLGDWIKIKMPVKIHLTKYGFKARSSSYLNRVPEKYKIYGSNNGTDWIELVHKKDTDSTLSYSSSTLIFEESIVMTTESYDYFGLVVNKLKGGADSLNLDEWYIYGQEYIYEDPDYKTLTFTYDATIYPQIDADATNLIAHYKFDGNFNDSTSNGNDLTVGAGTPTTTNTEKVIGKSANFLADNSYVENSSIDLSNSEFTVSVWIKTTSISSDSYFVSQGNSTGTNTHLHMGIRHNGGNIKYALNFWSNDMLTTTTYSSDIGIWVHLVFIVEANNNRKIYRNGILIQSDSNTSSFNSTGTFKVGARYESSFGNYDYTGYLDDLRIYDKVLTADEINTLYNVNQTINQTSYDLTFDNPTECDILIVGGGGGGGSGTTGSVIPGSGGGAGGLIFLQNQTVDSGTYTISVGKGGNKAKDNTETGHNGYNSSFSYLQTEALGGGGGGSRAGGAPNGVDGGSGGGGNAGATSGAGTHGQGHISDIIKSDGTTILEQNYRQGFEGGYQILNQYPYTGGGGGAGDRGKNDYENPDTFDGDGGIGKSGIGSIDYKTLFGISDTAIGEHHTDSKVYFAGGGACGETDGNESTGGLGGGGDGHGDQLEKDGKPNTGGGGAGGKKGIATNGGGNGGSGIVIIRYKTTNTKNSVNLSSLVVNQTIEQPIIDIKKNDDSVLFIDESGNVGINNNTPQKKLHIEGDTLINGNLLINDLNIMTHIENTSNNLTNIISNTNFLSNTISNDDIEYTNFKHIHQSPVTEYTVLNCDIYNLKIWYKFDGELIGSRIKDYGLLQNHLDIYGSTNGFNTTDYVVYPSSYENNAIDNNYLKMYQNLDLYQYQSTTGLSISFWFKITQTASSTNQYGSFFWFQNTTNNNNLHVRIYDNTNDDFLISIDTYAPSNYIRLTPDPPVNIWTHFVLTIDNEGNWSVYIDNINKLITKQVNLSNSIFDDCKILSGTNDTTTIGAIMDDFRIYNKVLTVDEISLLYNRELRIPINLPLINPKPYIEELTGMTDWIKIKHCPVTVGKISGNTFSGSTIDGTFTIGDENDNTAEWAIPFNSDNVKYFCFHSKDSYINSDFKDRWIVIERSEMIKEIQYQSSGGYGYNSLYPHYYKTTYKPNGFVAKTSTYYVGGRRDQIIYNRSGSSLPDPQIATYYVKKDGTPIDPHINNDNLYILVHPYAHYLMYRENGSTELNGIEQSVYVKYTDDIQISINIEPKSVYDTHYTLEYLAEQKTGVKGWRLVRFLPPTSTTWYSVNDNSFGTAPAYGTAYDYTNEWSLDYGGTFDEMFFSTKNMIYWLWTPKTSIEGEYSNVGRLVYKSSNNSSQHNVAWYNRSAYTVDPFISVLNHSVTVNQCLYAENSFSDAHTQLIAGNEGMCVFVRNSTDVITVNNIPEPNYNTLTFGYNESLISYPILDCDSYNLVAHFTFDDSGNLFNNLGKNEIEATGLSGNTTNDGDYTQDGKILGGLYKLSTGDITGYKLTPSNLLSQYFSNKISLTFWIKNEQHVAPHLFRQDDVLSIGIWENALRVIIYDTESTSLYYEVDDQDLSFLQLNEWVHVVITIDASANSSYENSIKVYRNSVNRVLKTPPLSTSYTLGNNFFNSINDFKILGRGNDGGGNGFKGYIDDLRFYDKVLSQEEVTSLYNQYSQTKYEINFSNPTKCDILIVGGGGAGGVDNGGGGGGGGVLYATDIELNGTYTIKVGDGGKTAIPINNPDGYNAKNSGNGYSSEFGIENDMVEVLGGGYGGNAGNTGTISTNGGYGGSGGGGVYNDGIGGIKLQPIYNSLITSANSTYYSGNGGTSVGNIGGGGGGAGGIIPTNHNGADGIQINIDGNNYYWGGGGGGIYWENTAGSGGLGGGGGAGGLTGMEGLGGLGGITNGEDGTGAGSGSTPQGIGGNGGAGTGGGGGGDAYSSPNKGGNGGSGIVIIRYRETYENKNNLISIKNNNNNGITINNKDYIGINNDYPTNTFDINGNININNNENKTALIVTQNTNLPIVDIKKNNDSILFIDNLGNIGINNKLPQKNLHIEVDTLINNNDLIIMNGNIGIGTDNFSQHKLHVIGNTNIDGDLNVSGGLTISGGQTTIDTDVYTTEQLSITNDGSGPALLINQNGTGNILDIKEHNNTILFIKDGGNIGIGTTSPTASLQVGIGTIVSNVDNKSSVCILSEQKPNEELIALSLVNYNNTNPPTSFGTASSIAFHVNKDWEPTAKIMAINTDINIDSTATYKQYTDLVFYTFYHGPLSESMRITCQGDVGIGTATPVSKLDVNGNLNITGDINFTGLINQNSIPIVLSTEITAPANNNNNKVSANIGIHNTDYAFLDLRTNNNLGGWIDFSSIAGEDFSTRIRGHNDPVKLEFYASSTPDMILNSNGDLNVKGNITAYYSDERLKTKIENIDNVLDKIKKISVFKYKPNDIATKYGFSNKQEIGLSAQQISYFYPELVSLAPFDREYDNETKMDKSKSGENYLTLNYERLVPILIQGIKELTKENDFLKNEIIDIKKIINNKN